MAENEAEPHVFALPEFWQMSQWPDQLDHPSSTSSSPFFSRDLERALQGAGSGLVALAHPKIPDDGFFKQPTGLLEYEPENVEDADPSPSGPPSDIDGGFFADVWMDLDESLTQPPTLQTWEAFLTRTTTIYQPLLISEAGPAAFDALLSSDVDPLKLKESDIPVVQNAAYFSSLLALALGRESILYTKRDQSTAFQPVLPQMRISGYSRHVLRGLEKQCLSCGSAFHELRSFVQSTYAKQSTRCRIAFASSIDQVLRIVQEHLLARGKLPRSLLQLQSIVTAMKDILAPFRVLASQISRRMTDEHLISLVFDQASVAEHSENFIQEIMREILQKVSRPWTEFVEEWIGTRREEGVPLSKSDVGQRKGFIKVGTYVYVDDNGEEVEEVDFQLDQAHIPEFFPDELTESIFETGRNLRFIRTSHPEHALARPDTIVSCRPPSTSWLYDWDGISQLEGRLAEYRDNLLASIHQIKHANQSMRHSDIPAQSDCAYRLDMFGSGQGDIESKLLASIDHFNQPAATSTSDDSLARVVRQRLSGGYVPANRHTNSTPHWSLLPNLSFGSIVTAQARIVNRESLKLLFRSHDLRDHLRLQHDFHLLGNGNFCSRLSHALFDPDLETAERQVGVARQGGIMGLRLGGRETWPPASSELRLALMGVLAEAYYSQKGLGAEEMPSAWSTSSDLPGDLSFSVRDLSEDEINKCMNVDSLEALDFLRLSYKAPPELASVITPRILIQYDRIFKHLLRVLRMLYVVNQLSRDLNSRSTQWHDPSIPSYRFGIEARHFVNSVSTYFMDTGVGVPWQEFESKIDEVEAQLEQSATGDALDQSISPRVVELHHTNAVERVSTILFLRKRQQPVLKLLEDIFGIILVFAKYSRLRAQGRNADKGSREPSELYKRFKQKVQVFVTVCRGLTEKNQLGPKKGAAKGVVGSDGMGDDSTVAQLLLKLDMLDYYSKR
ncbi:Spc98 family-domain-containing protein [Stachybotrys elegans]|uniref:Spindle pole body component n=1 Tax=Stachybotrys elegans TaxID=80388 RepID=A0A8K0WW01_9HYPO|nr:Spc98 family-domain-containing protein [Stachybotrys elegans]